MALQLPRKQRLIVMGLFGAGFLACAAGIVRTYFTWYKSVAADYDSTWNSWSVWLASGVELYIGIVRLPPEPVPAFGGYILHKTNANLILFPDLRFHPLYQTLLRHLPAQGNRRHPPPVTQVGDIPRGHEAPTIPRFIQDVHRRRILSTTARPIPRTKQITTATTTATTVPLHPDTQEDRQRRPEQTPPGHPRDREALDAEPRRVPGLGGPEPAVLGGPGARHTLPAEGRRALQQSLHDAVGGGWRDA